MYDKRNKMENIYLMLLRAFPFSFIIQPFYVLAFLCSSLCCVSGKTRKDLISLVKAKKKTNISLDLSKESHQFTFLCVP